MTQILSSKSSQSMTGLLFLGDSFFYTPDKSNPFEHLPHQNRLTIVNCETVLNNDMSNSRSSGWKLIKVSRRPQDVNQLAVNTCDVFSLANNHTMDHGPDGLEQTKQWLHSKGKKVIGTVSHSYTERMISGTKVAIYACLDITGPKYRTFPNVRQALVDIARLKKRCDFVAINIHWGREYADFPSPRQRKVAARLIEHGADLIIGHHPHVFQGMEIINGRRVYYSLGNANFGVWQNSFSQWSTIALVVSCDFSKGKPQYTELFYGINDQWHLVFLNEKTKRQCLERLNAISGTKLHKGWLSWGMESSGTFVSQETDALQKRFQNSVFRGLIVTGYWLTRPATIFLLMCYMLQQFTTIFRSKRTSQ